MKTLLLTLTFLFLSFSYSGIYATTFTVNTLVDGGAGSLRQAIIDGNTTGDNHTINFSVSGTIFLGSDLPAITKSFTINAQGITINGNGSYYAILAFGNITLEINNLTIISCSSSQGPAVNTNTNLTVLNYCVFENNNASDDGGAIISRENLELNYCNLSGNTAGDTGGAIRLIGGNVTFNNSLIYNNGAANSGGGAVVNSRDGIGGNLTMINTTVSGNLADSDDGGGIRVSNGNLVLNNVTITDNEAGDDGGGIMLNSSSTLTMNHTILAGNTASDDGPDMRALATPASNGYNIIGNTADAGFTPATGDLINIDPLLDVLADNGGPTFTHRLLDSSPAINAGGPCQSVDQRGFFRFDGACDIGAFEDGAAAAIPTLSQWSLIMLSLVFMILGLGFLKYKSPVRQSKLSLN